ncbi:MAG: ATP-binding protein [Alphaproteobacteria bacterium]
MSGPITDEERLLELRFPARPDRMALVRKSIRGAALDYGFDDFAIQEIVLAISEACQNVMRHSYTERETGDIVVSLSRTAERLIIRVTDFAPTVDPTKIRSRDLSDIRPGGLGVHFITELMETVEYLPGPGGVGNILLMTRKTEVSP